MPTVAATTSRKAAGSPFLDCFDGNGRGIFSARAGVPALRVRCARCLYGGARLLLRWMQGGL